MTPFAYTLKDILALPAWEAARSELRAIWPAGRERCSLLEMLRDTDARIDWVLCLLCKTLAGRRFAAKFACECAMRVLREWDARFSDDARPPRAIDVLYAWLHTEQREVSFQKVRDAYVDVIDAGKAVFYVTPPSALKDSGCAADIAVEAAAYYASSGIFLFLSADAAAAYSLEVSALASSNPDAERVWQRARLIELLERADDHP